MCALLVTGLAACSDDDGGSAAPTASAASTAPTAAASPPAPSPAPPAPTASRPPSTTARPSVPARPTTPAADAIPAALTRYYAQRAPWGRCADDDGDIECAEITVPLDYARPTAGDIKIAINRVPASGRRVGSLLVNPGGPGASGLDYAAAANQIVGDDIRSSYDIVGFDPRGVGQSSPVKCLSDDELDDFIATDPAPESRSQIDDTEEQAKELADGCAKESGALLAHVGTPDAARDMDVIRAAVGDPKLNYLGKSYGTYLGATYAGLFPTRVGRVVLDGAIDPALSSDQLDLGQARGFQTAVEAFLQDWIDDGDCPLGDSVSAAQRKLGRLLGDVVDDPLPTGTDRDLTSGQAFLGVVAPLYDRQAWPNLRTALTELDSGRGDLLLSFSDLYSDRSSEGRYTSNANEAIYAVNCLDRPDSDRAPQIEREVPDFEKASPVFGGALAWSSLPCADWPVKSGRTPAPITAKGSGPILVVGTTRDPATPYDWAVSLAQQLTAGVLLTRDGDGHTGYLMGNGCIDEKVETYLLKGTPPADGTRCGA